MFFYLLNKWNQYKSETTDEFYTHIEDLLEHHDIRELDKFIHHYSHTRLKHSLDVAYYSYFVAKLLNWDSRSVARAGLMHDLFFYDWRDDDQSGRAHAAGHPKIALENAKNVCELNRVEEDIILKHMWLVTAAPPRYREGYIVTFVDKYCAVREITMSIFSRSTLRTVFESI